MSFELKRTRRIQINRCGKNNSNFIEKQNTSPDIKLRKKLVSPPPPPGTNSQQTNRVHDERRVGDVVDVRSETFRVRDVGAAHEARHLEVDEQFPRVGRVRAVVDAVLEHDGVSRLLVAVLAELGQQQLRAVPVQRVRVVPQIVVQLEHAAQPPGAAVLDGAAVDARVQHAPVGVARHVVLLAAHRVQSVQEDEAQRADVQLEDAGHGAHEAAVVAGPLQRVHRPEVVAGHQRRVLVRHVRQAGAQRGQVQRGKLGGQRVLYRLRVDHRAPVRHGQQAVPRARPVRAQERDVPLELQLITELVRRDGHVVLPDYGSPHALYVHGVPAVTHSVGGHPGRTGLRPGRDGPDGEREKRLLLHLPTNACGILQGRQKQ